MNVSQEDYQRVARVLDGEDLSLSADQRRLLDQILQDEDLLEDRLDVRTPKPALDRAWRRMQGGLARPRQPARWILAAAGAAAAAAAAAVVALVLLGPEPTGPTRGPSALTLPEPSAEDLLAALAGEPEDELIRETQQQVDELGFQVSLAPADPQAPLIEDVDTHLLEAQRELQQLLGEMVQDIPEEI